jgi:hypothetical protein
LKKTIGAILLALLCWAYPIKTLAQTAEPKPKVEIKNQDYVSEDIIIKDNAIQPPKPIIPTTPRVVRTGIPKNTVPLSSGTYNGRNYSKEEVQQLIRDYSAQYGISADLPLRVANCESGFNQVSKNRSSTASGVFQYLNSTWIHTDAGKSDISVFDADANVHMAIKSIASGGIGNWSASKSCWSK